MSRNRHKPVSSAIDLGLMAFLYSLDWEQRLIAGEEGKTEWSWPASMLLVTGNDGLADDLATAVTPHGTTVSRCATPIECLQRVRGTGFASILIECGGRLPLGLQLCRSLRAMGEAANLPIILWSAGIDGEQRVAAYESGADEVLQDAQISRESLFRIRAASRRGALPAQGRYVRHADLELDIDGFRVRRCGQAVALSAFQTRLLHLFVQQPGKVFSRRELSDALWGGREINAEVINTAIMRLRRLLRTVGAASPIRSVKGEGYSLDLELGKIRTVHAEL